MASMIQLYGAKNIILATDGGQSANPPPVKMFKIFIKNLLESGISERDIQTMIHDNPAKLLNL